MSVENLVGQTLGQYELRELLGEGGMGAVYKGYQANLRRYVAVKVLAARLVNQAGALERFNREAQTSAALEHPNIIPIYDYGTQRGISYLVLKLLSGGSLAERLEQSEGKLPSLGEIATLLKALGSALDYAHSQGVIHRDIKPSNVMFDNHGQPYLVDFGIAKLVESTAGGLTASGMVVGTWGYMAPEQWRAEELSGATDQYALAVMTYALITGRMPFDAPTPAAIMHRHLSEMPTPPHTVRPAVPQAVTAALERALAKDARQRFPTCTAFAQTFDSAIRGSTGPTTQFFTAPVQRRPPRGPTSASQPSQAYSQPITVTQPFYKSRAAWAMIALIVVMAAVIVALAAGVFSGEESATTAPPPTQVAAGPTLTATDVPLIVVLDTPTVTPTATPTATIMPTANATEIEQTIQAVMNAALTLTATQWTPTPTLTVTPSPTYTPTIDVAATAEARLAMTQAVIDVTNTAIAWTDTPTPTKTPTSTPTPTPTLTLTPTRTLPPDPLTAARTPVARNADWTPVVRNFNGVEMVLVPAGCFMMGSREEQIEAAFQQCESERGTGNCEREWFAREEPVHEVCFEQPFWIDRYEVSQGQFAAFGGQAAENSHFSGADRPQEQITWYEARDFCERRGARLPTEAEWEYAARGPDGLAYPWGDTFDCKRGDFDDETQYDSDTVPGGAGCDGYDDTAPVGSFPSGVSWVGALDLSGNVWEWVADWYGTYPSGRQVNPQGPTSGEYRVLRGGSWLGGLPDLLRGAFRFSWNPGFAIVDLGFRCALSLE